jgi:hypothetical protein
VCSTWNTLVLNPQGRPFEKAAAESMQPEHQVQTALAWYKRSARDILRLLEA